MGKQGSSAAVKPGDLPDEPAKWTHVAVDGPLMAGVGCGGGAACWELAV